MKKQKKTGLVWCADKNKCGQAVGCSNAKPHKPAKGNNDACEIPGDSEMYSTECVPCSPAKH